MPILGKNQKNLLLKKTDDNVEPIAEFRFVPSDESAMFTAMCECQALHPDPEDEERIIPFNSRRPSHTEEIRTNAFSVCVQSITWLESGEDSIRDYEDGMEVDTIPTVAGQFEDAD
ncbi:hypothetical protein GH733_008733, partial [Mirounga leonina]